ncbi:NAD-dependent epimerase [Morganella psychrotolerans]|uniref:Protein CapI n=1 Tax=Morganella psychrotolerans TaxID=368603 RepID=A0A1B8HT56_9GAMM|nr:NAD-dependent epimerase [Morganella psychrotolerans]OBU12767.1 protein CapI [Morganella psychrotolerans]
MKYLVTGSAGFIGFYVAKKLLEHGFNVVGIDNINDYYDVSLKQSRLNILKMFDNFSFYKIDISDKEKMAILFKENKFDKVIHLAAQAGVRYSLINPFSYSESNLTGFLTILEGCRHNDIKHLIYASSSSVYGLNDTYPFSTNNSVDHPISLYAATKKSNELMAHSYSYLYNIPVTGLRFFTVYGPWGRPDMALFKFTNAIINEKPIDIYNNGEMSRDFTYIDDIVDGIYKILSLPPKGNKLWKASSGILSTSSAPYQIYNIGNGKPISLMKYIESLEENLKIKAIKNYLPMQPGDVYKTYADTNDLFEKTGYIPKTNIDDGIQKFVEWYKDFYKLSC